ncbi:MAG: glycosyltransferase family 1 protein [candidate division WOR-3 bacterium]|nr:MAG: glycosyltransferase family 1 protein [candidate division WOR-3 bacterium]
MHIVLLPVGSRGDVQPFMALGLGLQAAGHRVTIVTHEEFKPSVLEHGVEYGYLPGNIQKLIGSEHGQSWLQSGENIVAFMLRYPRMLNSVMNEFYAAAWQACHDAECIIYSIFGSAGYHIAEALGIPSICAPLQPITRTSAFPFMGGFRTGNIKSLNYMTYLLSEQLFWQPVRNITNRWRVKTLHLPPLPPLGPFKSIYKSKQTHLYGISQTVLKRPDDWPESHHITGYWFLNSSESWSPGVDLRKFMSSGPKPVYVGFGSMISGDPEEMFNMVKKALQVSGKRGIIATGWSTLKGDSDEDIYVTDHVPHDWLFPKVAAVVHHGGAGTTAAGLRAGVPSVILPFFADQPFWGKRVAALGAGPSPIMQQDVTVTSLARAIVKATADPGIMERSANIGRRIRAENGVACAVEIVHRCIR